MMKQELLHLCSGSFHKRDTAMLKQKSIRNHTRLTDCVMSDRLRKRTAQMRTGIRLKCKRA